jgi:hypothetical protein
MRLVCAGLISIVLLSACASVPNQRANAYHFVNERSCALIVGGETAETFADPRLNQVWFTASKAITDDLFRDMMANGYPVKEYIVPLDAHSQPMEQLQRNIALAMAVNRCNRIIQIYQTVSEDQAGKFFGYRVDVMLGTPVNPAAPSAGTGTRVTMVGEYTKQYRYPRTEETLRTLQFHKVAETILSDMSASGVLSKLR